MEALYFRLMYQNVANGTIHTVSVSNTETKEIWNGCYLCTSPGCEEAMRVDTRFQNFGKKINLMVLGEDREANVKTALEIISQNQVEKVLFPGENQEAISQLAAAGAREVLSLKNGESCLVEGAGWESLSAACGEGKDTRIVMYHNAQKTDPVKQDTLLTVKPFSEKLECEACIDGDEHRCAMKCCLYNDFQTCKGHNGTGSQEYITATLLLGNLDMERYGEEIRELIGKKGTVRFCSFTGETRLPEWLDAVNENINQYVVVPAENGIKDKGVLIEILKKGLRHQLVMTQEKNGLCATGFFTNRV